MARLIANKGELAVIMDVVKDANLLLRLLLELCTLAALGYWGFRFGKGIWLKIGLGIGAPFVAALIWATFVSPNASVTEQGWLHFLLEISILGSASVALYFCKLPKLCFIFTAAVVSNILLMTLWGQ